MKKLLATFLLFVMAMVAAQPVVALHYCGGEFQTLHLYQIEDEHACCHNMEMTPVEHHTACCAVTSEGGVTLTNIIDETYEDGCCKTEITELGAEVFQSSQGINFSRVLLPATGLLFLFNMVETVEQPLFNNNNLKNTFPPEGRFLADVENLLSYICILRI